MKLTILLLLVFSLIFIQCNSDKSYFANLLQYTDIVSIRCFYNNDTLSRNLTDKKGLNIFKETIQGKHEDILTGTNAGEILFFSKGKLLLRATRIAEGIEYNLNKKGYKERITYRAGMYFDEVCSELLKK